jgi:hypothetical protein
MATITTRSGKGSPLTNSEVDANFTNLNTDKLEDAAGSAASDGNEYVRKDGAWAVATGGGGGASVTTSATAPSSPSDGDLWFSETNGVTYVYYNDGNSSQWVASGTPSASVSGGTTLDGLTDTNLGTPADGDQLAYDSATSKWISEAPTSVFVREADTWQSAAYQLNGAALTGTWSRLGVAVGTGMSVSSGVFTFPSTGKYRVQAEFEFSCFGSAVEAAISWTQNGGTSWGNLVTCTGTLGDSTTDISNGTATLILDIQSTANNQVRIYGVSAGAGDSVSARLHFERLGDT